jgi:hypothetical protein
MVINNSVVFIPIPKNASWSVEDTCIEYGLNLTYPNVLWENSIKFGLKNPEKHIHSDINYLVYSLGVDYEFVCIIRDSTDRFISAWKFFVQEMGKHLPKESANILKNLDNNFIISFFKDNIYEFKNAYISYETRVNLLIKLLQSAGVIQYCNISDEFKKRYAIHIMSFVSQYQWISSSKVKVKEFHFDRLYEFEDYLSKKLNIDFKLIHKNKTKLDYSAILKTNELITFVDTYIDGAYKRNISLI